jgi:hypothetical protein
MRAIRWWVLAGLVVVAACGEQQSPVSVAEESEVRPIEVDDPRRAPMERLARRVAMALADPAFRAYVRASLEGSPYVERKLPFSRFVAAEGNRAALAMAAGEGPEGVAADLREAGGLEFYFPIPEHARRWQGEGPILVATEVNDHEAPVAFDMQGRRVILDPRTPPAIPVLALVPQETDFDAPLRAQQLPCDTCDPESPPQPPQPPIPGSPPASLRMTYFSVNKDFEGWLRGSPEYEVHVMGPVSQTDTSRYRTLYCIGENGADRFWNNNEDRWSGDVVLMSAEQLDAYHTAFPRNNFSILAIEDDDTSCEIKVDRDRFSEMVNAASTAYSGYKGARDSLGFNGKTIVAAKAAYNFLRAVADFFKTNDDMIGIAFANTVTGYYSAEGNWSWIGEGANRYGWVKFEMR